VQVVLPEDLCNQLSELAKKQSRTVSNMAKVLIQEGIQRFDQATINNSLETTSKINTERFRSELEEKNTKHLRGAPRRIRFFRP
tara:strand:+ start:1428 stop:1679 length:252 start_codon:yes stop_codon:yes gene_type:complete